MQNWARCRFGTVLGLLCLALGATVGPVPAAAQGPAVPDTSPADAGYASVTVDGRTLFDLGSDGRLTASARASRVTRRLQNLISREEPVAPFTDTDVQKRDGQTLVVLGGEPIVAVTPGDAQDNLSTPEELARRWGDKMSAVVADARAVRSNPLHGAGILIRNSARDLFLSVVSWLPRLAGALFLVVVFWLLARMVATATRFVTERARMDANLEQLARAVAFYGTWAVGIVAIFSTLGLETGGLVAALGVSGFVLGFAFKDILSHFLAGMMLLVGRQFRIGDQIVFKEHEGTVERIELRALYLRTYDNRLVIIPNAEVFTSVITSNTASPHRRRDFVVGIGYEQDIERAREVALETVRATPGVLEDPAPDVLVDELAASVINLRVRFYTNSLRADYLKVGSACMQRVKETFARRGISMPTDIKTLVLGNVDELADGVRRSLSGEEPPSAGAALSTAVPQGESGNP